MTDKIISIIADILNMPENVITENTKMDDIENWDSLTHVMIIGELEEQLHVEIPLDEAADLTSVKEIIEYLEKSVS